MTKRCPLLALSGRETSGEGLLLGGKSGHHRGLALSAYDPKRTYLSFISEASTEQMMSFDRDARRGGLIDCVRRQPCHHSRQLG
jgi:hypothetical protein